MNFSITRRRLAAKAGLISALPIPPSRKSASSTRPSGRGARLS